MEAGQQKSAEPTKALNTQGGSPSFQKPPLPSSLQGFKQEVFTLPSGDAVLIWPAALDGESYEDFEAWVHLVLKKAKRAANTTEARPTEQAKPEA